MATFKSFKQPAPINGTPPNYGMRPRGEFGGMQPRFQGGVQPPPQDWASKFPGFAGRMKNDPWMQSHPGLQGFMDRIRGGMNDIPPQSGFPGAPTQPGVMGYPTYPGVPKDDSYPGMDIAPPMDGSQLPNGGAGLIGNMNGRIPPQNPIRSGNGMGAAYGGGTGMNYGMNGQNPGIRTQIA